MQFVRAEALLLNLRLLLRAGFVAALGLTVVLAALPQPPALPAPGGDTFQHALAFVILTILLALAYPRLSAEVRFGMLAGFGAVIELMQMIPMLGRDASLGDWGVDLAAIGATILTLWGAAVLNPRRET